MATMKTLNGYGFNATELGGKAPEYYIQPRNLLDNSDFTNPVNQRGVTSKTDILRYAYFIDRWHNSADITTKYGLSNQGVTISGNAGIRQEIEGIGSGTVLTAAIKYGGKIICVTGTIEYNDTSYKTIAYYGDGTANVFLITQGGNVGIMFSKETSVSSITVEWAALYEGSYTADTLPPYVPKGYPAELTECQRYFYKMKSYWKWVSAGICESSTKACIPIVLPREMRITPTVSITNPSLIKVKCGNTGLQIPSNINWAYGILDARIMQMEATVTGATDGNVAFLYFDDGGEITFSADL